MLESSSGQVITDKLAEIDLSKAKIETVKAFMIFEVYVCCNLVRTNKLDRINFGLTDLFGRGLVDWDHTPLMDIYSFNLKKANNDEKLAEKQAWKDISALFRNVVIDEKYVKLVLLDDKANVYSYSK